MSNGEYTSAQHAFRELCEHRARDGRCKIKQEKVDAKNTSPDTITCFCDRMSHPCPQYKIGTKLVKNVNAIQVYCKKCDYVQLVPKRGSKACKACGYTRTEIINEESE